MRLLSIALFMLVLSGCSYFIPDPGIPPPCSLRNSYQCEKGISEVAHLKPVIPDPCLPLNLCELVGIALENSPLTKLAWFGAKSAAADVGFARGAYLPPVLFTTSWTKDRYLVVGEPEFALPIHQTNANITLSTTYLLFDFGGRNGNLQQALAALSSMNWFYNWEVQTVMIQVIRSYYNYLNALEVFRVDHLTVGDNKIAAEAAIALSGLGVKTLADVLQAETALLQSQVALEQHRGAVNVALATLLQSLGLPQETSLTISPLPDSFPIEKVCKDASTILQYARNNRADLAALRSIIQQNKAKIRSVRAAFFPNISTNLEGGKGWINDKGPLNEYSVSFALNYPLFSSFADINALRKAQAELQMAQAELENEELQAYLTVLTDYYDFLANTEVLKISEKYIETALKNRDVTYENYIAGITSIIDLMTANQFLNEARVQLADAKTNFLTSLANLSFNTGGLQVTQCTEETCIN